MKTRDRASTLRPTKAEAQAGSPAITDEELVRGLRDYRMAGGNTVIGGYGEFNLNFLRTGSANPLIGRATVRRLVLFLAHNFNEKFRTYMEIEWENAVACSDCAGGVEIEQAFIDWRVLGDDFGLRAGLVLVPMGIINQWHEAPVYHGVNRPDLDRLIIPTTWRELGLGAFGSHGMMRYELYAITAFDPSEFSASGFRSGRGEGALQRANALAVTGRFEIEPWLGAVFGASFYASDAGGNLDSVSALNQPTTVHVPVYGWSLDARMRKWGFEARALFAQFFSPESDALMRAQRDVDGVVTPYFADTTVGPNLTSGPVATRIQGGYLELAYNVLRFAGDTDQQLLPFVRLEYLDTQAAVPTGFERNGRLQMNILTAGLSYRPIQQIVLKGDIQVRDRHVGPDEFGINFGLGYMF
ncbi:MAG: hypothetical protein IPK60_01695 [Sandaracinaceae bacterium]|nr:hypothetical protein [Sandaracinaceae bacterium]